MRIPLSKTCLAMLLSLLFAAPSQLWGWGGTGHEAVAYVAWQQITPATAARAIALLALVPSLTSPQNKSVPGYSDWIKDLPSGLLQDDKNLYLFMAATVCPATIKHVASHDSGAPPAGITDDANSALTDTKSPGSCRFAD